MRKRGVCSHGTSSWCGEAPHLRKWDLVTGPANFRCVSACRSEAFGWGIGFAREDITRMLRPYLERGSRPHLSEGQLLVGYVGRMIKAPKPTFARLIVNKPMGYPCPRTPV